MRGAISKLKNNKNITIKKIFVPGTFEIPFTISKLSKKFDAFVLLGCVIKGKTPHFDYLCSSVFNSILCISIKNNVPISNGILTCLNKKQAIQRSNPKKLDKGGHAASAVISLLKIK
tara:strand:- start:354 stop:704 length:351 start_codon:yes stop_codon:yes gene_type:complete